MAGHTDGRAAHKKLKRYGVVGLLTLLCGLVVVLVLSSWKDPRARRGYYEGKTPEEIREDLDSSVDWYSMEISVASSMRMKEGDTQVEARLENIGANHCDQKVKMYPTGDPSDVLYQSGAIAPGEYLQFVDLAHPLPIGRNAVTVEFQGYEQTPALVSDEGQFLGHDRFGASAAAEVVIDVLPMAASEQ